MNVNTEKSIWHDHPGPQCKDSDRGTICVEEVCSHDDHVSKDVEINCMPVEGQSNLYHCVHQV
jgi:hypothetical protein